MGKDLGTYHVRVELADGRGFIMKWETSARYFGERGGLFKLDATPIPPSFNDEAEVLQAMTYQFTDGNYGCDCNLFSFLSRTHDLEDQDHECGDTLELKRLTAIRPDRSEVVLVDVTTPSAGNDAQA
jgi:hypothetical protein